MHARTRTMLARWFVALAMIVSLGSSSGAQLLPPPLPPPPVLPPPPPPPNWLPKLDPLLAPRASLVTGRSRVIVRARDAGIIAGNGFDSSGARSGAAPGARLTVLKVLDGSGSGRISDVIAALGYVLTYRDALNIRVVNMSVATGVYESYLNDPLTLAAQ